MTIDTTTSRNGPYTGDGSNSAFPYTFKVFSAGHLEVIKTASGAETTLSSSAYTVSDVGSAGGGNVVVTSAQIPTSAETITIRLNPPFTQDIDLQNQGGFFPDVHEKGFDIADQRSLYLREMLNRALRIPVSDASSISMILPVASARSGGYLSFDASGVPTIVTGVLPSNVTVTSFAETLLDDTTASAARSTLSVPLLTNGTLVVGASAEIGAVGGLGADPVAQFFGSGTNIALELLAYSATATIAGLKANGTIGSASNVASGDALMELAFYGFFSAGYLKGAAIKGTVDGTAASNAMPTTLALQTTRPGASAPVDTLKLDAKGNVIVGSAQLATNATDGFLYLPNAAGAPTSTPTATTGRTPLVYDAAAGGLYAHNGTSWKKVSAIVAHSAAVFSANSTVSGTIPADSSVPLSSEGGKVIEMTYTPFNSACTLELSFEAFIGAASANVVTTVALFDGGSAAIAAKGTSLVGGTNFDSFMLSHEYQPATSAPITFSIRMGAASGDSYINGTTAAYYGGVNKARLKVRELL